MLRANDIRLAVIGGSGFLGSAIVREALDRGIHVTSISAPRLRWTPQSTLDAPSIDEATVARIASELAGYTAVVNAAGLSDATSSSADTLFGANALLPVVIARAAARAEVLRIVHISSAAVQGRTRLDETSRVAPFSPYSRSKALGELWLRREDEHAIIVRPTSVQGVDRAVTKAIARLAASPFGSYAGPPRPTQMTRVDTVAKAVLRLASPEICPPPIVLTPDEGLTTETFLRLLGGRQPKQIPKIIGKFAVSALAAGGILNPRLAAYSRRLEVLWFGQDRTPGWLDQQSSGTTRSPDSIAQNAGDERWQEMGLQARGEHREPRVLFGVTSGVSVRGFFSGQHAYLRSRGWDVHLACSAEGDPGTFASDEGVTYHPLPAKRRPSPREDLRTLLSLYWLVRRLRPDVCVWGSPKLGLIGPLVSRLTRTPSVYVIHGLRLETTSGLARGALALAERLACSAATTVVAVGHDLRAKALELKLTKPEKIHVLANGSANGVRASARPAPYHSEHKTVGYVGRVTPDKGLDDLVHAWSSILEAHPDARLVVVGQTEPDAVSESLAKRLASLPNARLRGHVDDLDAVYPGLSVLVLPSYREGLPNVILEAASHGVPCVTTTATGASEPVVDGVTGIVVPTSSPERLARAVNAILDNPTARDAMGEAARTHILDRYAQPPLWRAWSDTLQRLARRPPSPDNLVKPSA